MKPSYLIYSKRTPIGRIGGDLSSIRPDDMMALLFKHFSNSFDFDMSEIDDVIVGNSIGAGEDNRNVARMSLLLAGLPDCVPGVTINRLCASSLDAIIDASARINMGIGDLFLIGGVESMSRAPYVLGKSASAFGRDMKMHDTTFGWRFKNPNLEKRFELMGMGQTAEELVKHYGISRKDQDKFAYESHQKAAYARDENIFKNEILPIEILNKKKAQIITHDQGIRKETTLLKLENLKAAFIEDGSVTAGNSSSLNDGAACVAIASEDFIKRHNITPILEITGAGIRGVKPNHMGIGPVESTNVLCKNFGKKIEDFDVVELNEAFAAQALSCIQELNLDPLKVNLNGGAIALGHPLGCSGARIVTTLANIMSLDKKKKEGLATMCVGVGQGVSLSVRNCL